MLRTVVIMGKYSRMMDMGGVPRHKGNSQLRKKLQGSMSNTLKVRGILLDYNIISNQSPEAQSPSAETGSENTTVGGSSEKVEEDKSVFGSFSLPAHVADMASVLGVNVSANQRGVGIAKKEEVAVGSSREEEVVIISSQRQKSESETPPEPSSPKHQTPAADDPRLKYMKKLKEKRGLDAADLLKASSAAKDAPSGTPADASFHLNLRDVIKAQEKKGDPNKYGSRRWLPVGGMGSLLNYIQSRSIKIGAYFLPYPTQTNSDQPPNPTHRSPSAARASLQLLGGRR
jgi:hypothetical protein